MVSHILSIQCVLFKTKENETVHTSESPSQNTAMKKFNFMLSVTFSKLVIHDQGILLEKFVRAGSLAVWGMLFT